MGQCSSASVDDTRERQHSVRNCDQRQQLDAVRHNPHARWFIARHDQTLPHAARGPSKYSRSSRVGDATAFGTSLARSHGKHHRLVTARDVINVVSSSVEQHTTRARYGDVGRFSRHQSSMARIWFQLPSRCGADLRPSTDQLFRRGVGARAFTLAGDRLLFIGDAELVRRFSCVDRRHHLCCPAFGVPPISEGVEILAETAHYIWPLALTKRPESAFDVSRERTSKVSCFSPFYVHELSRVETELVEVSIATGSYYFSSEAFRETRLIVDGWAMKGEVSDHELRFTNAGDDPVGDHVVVMDAIDSQRGVTAVNLQRLADAVLIHFIERVIE